MAAYFASDVHLRLDCPERGRRFARFVGGLEPEVDTLTIVGDLCDFWFGARQRSADPMECEGLRALAEFRSRGGAVTILLGNHDSSLGPFYAAPRPGPPRGAARASRCTVCGFAWSTATGSSRGGAGKRGWRAGAFSGCFQALAGSRGFAARSPAPVVATNAAAGAVERRYYDSFREYAASCRGAADLVLIGHVHTPLDAAGVEPAADRPRRLARAVELREDRRLGGGRCSSRPIDALISR